MCKGYKIKKNNPKKKKNWYTNETKQWLIEPTITIYNNIKYIRMDTVGINKGLINHYTKLVF